MSTDQRIQRRILVTGVGGAPGFDLARALLRLGCDVIATDSDPLAPGLLLPTVTPRVTTAAADERYRADLLRLCAELRPDAIISTVERELPKLVILRRPLADLGVTTWLPDAQGVEACVDKAAFHAALTEYEVPTPRTVMPDSLGDLPEDRPLVVKPRWGQGAQNVVFCQTREQARILCEVVPDPIVQERVTGREFTADCLVDRSGRASVILRYRLLVKGGLAVVSRTFHDQEAEGCVRRTLAAVGAAGACCAQGFLRAAGPERVLMTEVNARVGGGFLTAEAADADLAGQLLAGLFHRPVDHSRLAYQPGVCLTKYTETPATTTQEQQR
ncbi:ATP-grasp domain-containing protein [Streptomyces sp. AP-93]|uniref:ATP-grasp domain-containing protein n=1 Tax=Streptomyces sp. AP-93 TaxID=2929048 RepID=UPI001FAF6811|nr:ATP-grasp domain-containing protein [Streptomyces sp. AP-93]MCJ0868018.1 ATP-grasp domain-containing protein [Streptomyces sp. AP-93]